MSTLKLSPEARSTPEQSSSCEPGAPVIVHWPLLVCDLITQSAAVPAGSGSLRPTFFAVPGPAFETLTVNSTGSPAFTVWVCVPFPVSFVTDNDGALITSCSLVHGLVAPLLWLSPE